MITPFGRMITMILHVEKKEAHGTKCMSNASKGNIWCSFKL